MKKFLSSFLSIFFLIIVSANADDLKKPHVLKIQKVVEDYLNSHKSISADFTQTDNNNAKRTGKFLIQKPNNVRVDYYTPENETIIVDENITTLYNKPLDELNYIVTDNPIQFLSKSHINLSSDVMIRNAFEDKKSMTIEMDVIQKQHRYIITLQLIKNPLTIINILTSTPNGSYTELELKNVSYDPIFDSAFHLKRRINNNRK